MYNAIKPLIIFIALFFAMMPCLQSCSSDKSRAENADKILAEAHARAEAHDYQAAFVLLDTLDKGYRDCLEQRRAGTRLRMEALKDMTLDSIRANDSLRNVLSARLAEMAPQFRHVDVAGTAGYDVAKSLYTGSEMASTSIQPRIDEDGLMFIAINVSGRSIGINSLSLGEVSTLPAANAGVVVEGSEIQTIGNENLGDFVTTLAASSAPITVNIIGSKGRVPVKLDNKAIAGFRLTKDYSDVVRTHRTALIKREKLERQLSRLRDNLANLPEETSAAD